MARTDPASSQTARSQIAATIVALWETSRSVPRAPPQICVGETESNAQLTCELALSNRRIALDRCEHAQHDVGIARLLKVALVPHTASLFGPDTDLPRSPGERQVPTVAADAQPRTVPSSRSSGVRSTLR